MSVETTFVLLIICLIALMWIDGEIHVSQPNHKCSCREDRGGYDSLVGMANDNFYHWCSWILLLRTQPEKL